MKNNEQMMIEGILAWTLSRIGPRDGWLMRLRAAQAAGDSRENVSDLRTEQRQDRNHDDSHQDEDQRVLNQALTFFTREIHSFSQIGRAHV